MLKAKIDVKTLSSFIDSIVTITRECRFHITEEGIGCMAVDPANVALVKISIPKNEFSEYIATPSDMCIDITKVKEALGKMSAEKDVEMIFTESSNKIELISGKFKYNTRCLSDASVRPDPKKDPSNIQLDASFSISGQTLSQSINACTSVADKVGFSLTPEQTAIISASDEDTMNVELKSEIVVIGNKPEMSLFSSDYMKDLSKVLFKCPTVVVAFGTNLPIRFTGSFQKFEVVYVVAPRIES